MKDCPEREQVVKTIQQHGGVFSNRFTPESIELVPLEPNYIMKSELSPGHPVYSFRFIHDSDNLGELQDLCEYEIRIAYKAGEQPSKKAKQRPIRHHYTEAEELLIVEYTKNNPGPVASISYWNHALRNGLNVPHSAWSLKHHYYKVMPARNVNPKAYQPAKLPKKRNTPFSFKKAPSVEEVCSAEVAEASKKKTPKSKEPKDRQLSLQETINKSPKVPDHAVDFRTPAPASRSSKTPVSTITPLSRSQLQLETPRPPIASLSIQTSLTPQHSITTPQSAASRVSASSASSLKRKADETTPYHEGKKLLLSSRQSSSARSQASEMSDLIENRLRGFTSEIDNTKDICIVVSGNERKVIDMGAIRNRFIQEGFAQEFMKLVRICRKAGERDLREEEVLRMLIEHQGNALRTVQYYSMR
jgi:hypothetical protein